jgi:hypothetical protein
VSTWTPGLTPGRDYTWDELGTAFGFEPGYISVAGGMLSRPPLNALLLMTWPGGARSFDYDDYWDRGDLVYTGRGATGAPVGLGTTAPRGRSSATACGSTAVGSRQAEALERGGDLLLLRVEGTGAPARRVTSVNAARSIRPGRPATTPDRSTARRPKRRRRSGRKPIGRTTHCSFGCRLSSSSGVGAT